MMAYQRTSGHDHNEEHGETFIAIGEVLSEEDGHIAGVTLHELGIPFELAHHESEVVHIRRFLEGWSAGKRLFVKPEDATRASTVVGPRLAPTQIWTTPAPYLEQCPTEHLLKLLDFRAIWEEPWEEAVLDTAAKVLEARGISYPPDGSCSKFAPAIYLSATACLGPIGLFLVNSDRVKSTADGGRRPRYNKQTRDKLERCRRNGLIAWFLLNLGVVILGLLFPPGKRHEAPQKSSTPAVAPRR